MRQVGREPRRGVVRGLGRLGRRRCGGVRAQVEDALLEARDAEPEARLALFRVVLLRDQLRAVLDHVVLGAAETFDLHLRELVLVLRGEELALGLHQRRPRARQLSGTARTAALEVLDDLAGADELGVALGSALRREHALLLALDEPRLLGRERGTQRLQLLDDGEARVLGRLHHVAREL